MISWITHLKKTSNDIFQIEPLMTKRQNNNSGTTFGASNHLRIYDVHMRVYAYSYDTNTFRMNH